MSNYFIIDAQLPSLNDYQAACRANKYSGADYKKKAQELVMWAIYQAHGKGTLRKVQTEEYPVTLNIAWHEKDRRRDVDNIKSAAKFVLDGMTKSGLIVDDGRRYVAQIHDTVIDDTNTYVVVEIIGRERDENYRATNQPRRTKA